MRRWLCTLLAFAWGLAAAAPQVSFPRAALGAEALAVVINARDPYSVAVGEHYAKRRGIPPAQVIRVAFDPAPALEVEAFERLRADVERRLPAGIQAYALAWTRPWRVGCMSVTSAFAFGHDPAWCSASCRPTRPSPLYGQPLNRPHDDHGVRPAMLLAAATVDEAVALIDRSAAVEGRHPAGAAYLVSTTDAARNVRAAGFEATAELLRDQLPVRVVAGATVGERDDALFYFTGLPWVADATRLRLLDGALADHLTSFGGILEGGGQMSALAWLAAGASASYGTVIEPCAYPQKFPVPGMAMAAYLNGATALEAYWFSVAWPGEGVFVGDPLARPFAPRAEATGPHSVTLTLRMPGPGHLVLYGAESPMGPFRPLAGATARLRTGVNRLSLRGLKLPYYRAVPVPAAPAR